MESSHNLLIRENSLDIYKFQEFTIFIEFLNLFSFAFSPSGNMPIDEAETFGHQEIADYLLSWQNKPRITNKSDSGQSENSTTSASPSSSKSDPNAFPGHLSDTSPLP